MTMRQLAELAGVSVSTISKAFRCSREVSEQQREHIFRIARENDCFEKYYKVPIDKPVIGIVAVEFQSAYYAEQLSVLERKIRAHGGLVLTGSYAFDKQSARELFDYFTQHIKVDGIISYIEPPYPARTVPTVVVGGSAKFDAISISWNRPIAQMLDLLEENGHREIGYIGERYTRRKRTAFETEMKKRGLTPYIAETAERFEAAGYLMMQKLLAQPKPPTAVLAAYDAIAVGAMKAIYEQGLGVPGDISVVGMDDVKSNPYFDVPLTSVTSYSEDLCEIAVELLFDRMQNKTAKRKHVRVSAELVSRGSVDKAKR